MVRKRGEVDSGDEDLKPVGVRNRASPYGLTKLYKGFSGAQKLDFRNMEFTSFLHINTTKLHNKSIDWLASCYDPAARGLLIPGRGRIPMTEESVYNALGCPHGTEPVPYKVDKDIEARLAPEMFPGMNLSKTPLHSQVNTILKNMTESGDRFKRLVLLYIMSTILTPTTTTRISNRCYPVLDDIANVHNYNFCKFVLDQLDENLSKKKLNKGCRCSPFLHVAWAATILTAWTNSLIDEVMKADTKEDGSFGKLQMRNKVETIVGQFASGMTCLVGNLVQGWTGLTPPESEEMTRRFATVTGGVPRRSRTARGRFEGFTYPSDTDTDDEEQELDGCDSSDGDPPHNQDGDNQDVGMDGDDDHEGQGSGADGGNNNDRGAHTDNDEAPCNDGPGNEHCGGGVVPASGSRAVHAVSPAVGSASRPVMFPFLQLWGESEKEKEGHWYSISLNINQRKFEILDSLRGPKDDELILHSGEMVLHIKRAWREHYAGAKIQIQDFTTEHIVVPMQDNIDDRGYYMIEFMKKWDGRIVPALVPDDIFEARKILTHQLIMNQDFNEKRNAKEFIE
ncbi:hypothetical protein BRADI_4g33755v3 [Brachypodium distachyon]|uniref:Ubiquitin-like protease family profile domain-containing protein n=1 Tax=Brachypodium distachyon TaxID=15368 RepID=A0A0Q3LDV7_BRADI|nr:hypothetical protein BRADI_4g33755v3 [Brachypodium distachyon]